MKPNALVLKWFHHINWDLLILNCPVTLQGHILARVADGAFLVRLYDPDGISTDVQRVYRIKDLRNWHIFDSMEEMYASFHGELERRISS